MVKEAFKSVESREKNKELVNRFNTCANILEKNWKKSEGIIPPSRNLGTKEHSVSLVKTYGSKGISFKDKETGEQWKLLYSTVNKKFTVYGGKKWESRLEEKKPTDSLVDSLLKKIYLYISESMILRWNKEKLKDLMSSILDNNQDK